MTPRSPQSPLRLGTVSTGSGVDIRSNQGQQALTRTLLSITPKPTDTARKGVQQAQKTA